MTTETKYYKMLSTQKGVRHGEIHPVVFEKDKAYAIDAQLAEQFGHLNAIEETDGSNIEQPGVDGNTPERSEEKWLSTPESTQEPINEDVLDEDPAVLRASPVSAEQVHAQNDQAAAEGKMTPEAQVALGREDIAAEGEVPAEGEQDDADQKATAKKTKKK